MRPNSRGSAVPGTASGQAPGTGSIRPGSGRRPIGTASRLRTGASTGPGTQAAQGIALSTTVNVSDRPVTGQGMMGMKQTGSSTSGRLVEDAAYYVGILRKRVNDITSETNKLRQEIEVSTKENSQYSQLERKYEALLKNKESLEGQLADYNLALDKTRTSTDPDDVRHLAGHLKEKNAQASQELDRIFMLRKQKENEYNEIEEKIESHFKSIRNRIDTELEPGKRRAYNDLLNKQRELQERNMNVENKLNEINTRIRQLEADDKSSSLRKEYATIEKNIQSLRKDAEYLQQELDIANLEPKEAHSKFVTRVNDFKKTTKDYEEKIILLKEEISNDKKTLEDLNSNNNEDNGETAKYELLVKRDQEMTVFIDQFDETRNSIVYEQNKSKELIVALLEHLSKGLEESTNLPNQEVFSEMEDAKSFKEKNLLTAQKTMENLQIEKLKREQELELLKQSEPKLRKELDNSKETIARMKREMREFQDIDGLRRAFESTQALLQDQKRGYNNRKDSIRQQVLVLQSEHDILKKQLDSHEVAKELEETERRLKHHERTIFELREFIESKSRETDFETVKNSCLKLTDSINAIIIKTCQGGGVFSSQAKW